ncbi:MAG TPA: DoxX family protein [Polyangiaceae bacterium]|nr:DoxX family protein [Polyangiaceae bacterium]
MSATFSTKSVTVARLLLGLGFFVFGLNGFLGFLPNPEHTGAAGAYLGGLAAAGYMFPFIKGTELVVGVLLLANRFVPLALTVLAPVMLNIVAFHVFLEPATLLVPLLLLALHLYLAYSQRAAYASLLTATVATSSVNRGWTTGPAAVPAE